MKNTTRPDWGGLFQSILTEPGKIGEYYGLFHRYSLGNQALAMFEMTLRGIPIGPIASFNGWKKLGRKVKKGEKAIALWMPVVKKEVVRKDDGMEEERTKRFFVMKNNWFALAQTEPIDPENPGVPMPETPEWDRETALKNLGITEVSFTEVDGNCQGFARPDKAEIAINPLAAMPWKTTFHEVAHCLLHNKQAEVAFVDGGYVSRSIEEAEAESVAFLCCATLGLPGLEEARGYVQDWLGSKDRYEEFAKKSAARVFAAADKILKAGTNASKEGGWNMAEWFVEDRVPCAHVGYRAIVDENGYVVCEPSPMGEANARLIAAAPDLLAALERCVEQIQQMRGMFDDSDGTIQAALEDAQKAIDMVTGGTA